MMSFAVQVSVMSCIYTQEFFTFEVIHLQIVIVFFLVVGSVRGLDDNITWLCVDNICWHGYADLSYTPYA